MTIQKLWTTDELTKLGLGARTTIWRRVKDGDFPKPVKLSASITSPNRWLDQDIKKYFRDLAKR